MVKAKSLKNLKPFKPGQSGNPSGKPKDIISSDQVKALLGRFWRLKRDELQAVIQDPKSNMGEIMVASIMVKAAKDGDYSRVSFLLDRAIGRVKDQVEVTTMHPFIIARPNGSETILGATIDVEAKSMATKALPES